MSLALGKAPELVVSQWFNSKKNLRLDDLKGKITIVHAFQMLCPGCVSHGLPQASRMHEKLSVDDFNVIGLHTVFEHHAVMGPEALSAFIHEYRLTFPIGVDAADTKSPIPQTMRAWGLQGTPSVIVLDRHSNIRAKYFGRADDFALGLLLGNLLAEASTEIAAETGHIQGGAQCDADGCAIGHSRVRTS